MSLQNNNNSGPDTYAQGFAASVATAEQLGGNTIGGTPLGGNTLGGNSISGHTEERRAVQQGTGHVRLSGRDATLLSQMRNQYRKVFGVFFDLMEFTGNDLYARATLLQCVNSGNSDLATIAVNFLREDGKPRLHRRLGRADLELEVEEALPVIPSA